MKKTPNGSKLKEATSLSTKPALSDPKRGEIWLVCFDPTLGAEIRKTRPAVVISSDALRRLPLRLVAPITGWDPRFESSLAHVRMKPTQTNGLQKESAVDALQLRGVALERFDRKLGTIPLLEVEEIVSAVAAVIEFQ